MKRRAGEEARWGTGALVKHAAMPWVVAPRCMLTVDDGHEPRVTNVVVADLIVRRECDKRAPANACRVEYLRRGGNPDLWVAQTVEPRLEIVAKAKPCALERQAANEKDGEHKVGEDCCKPCDLPQRLNAFAHAQPN